ncbi:MAG TPA: hypothetical protein VFR97_15665 [Capillimicrobium sp.]|nr:hypothetical protein [Capillimicrobium sp.]
MPFRTHLLVVANQTVGSDELVAHLRDRARSGPLRVTLVVPAEPEQRDAAQQRLEDACVRLSEQEGIEVRGGLSEDADPLHAAMDAYDPARHDEIVVVTLPAHLSRWLGCDVPQRVARATGALVRVVETREAPVALHR